MIGVADEDEGAVATVAIATGRAKECELVCNVKVIVLLPEKLEEAREVLLRESLSLPAAKEKESKLSSNSVAKTLIGTFMVPSRPAFI